ncbi:MAG TPA: hypothetical protein VNW46_17220 [Gemmatimonadaceae bacterium]|jgi:hypothetical protein|nr:hypothetical protein [Gemmatimonadaceae bacterium]
MRHYRVTSVIWMVGVLATSGIAAGCMHHHDEGGGYVAVTWTDREEPYYERWEHDTHRDHVDWGHRRDDERQQYWAWRHDHQ